MFEKGKIVAHGIADERFADSPLVGEVDSAVGTKPKPARSGDALRAIEWSDLTARLNAARDLRRELREDTALLGGSVGASFGDAAARAFKALGEDERSVNHDDLEACKASGAKGVEETAQAFGGDERKQ